MEERKNFISKLYKVIAYIAVGILLIAINFGNIFGSTALENLKTIFFICLGLGIIFIINKFIIFKVKSEKVLKISIIIGLIIFLGLEVLSYKYFKVEYNWDFGTVMQASEDVAKSGVSDKIEYFLNYPHNVGCLAFETVAMKMAGGNSIGAYVLNIISIFLAALFGTLASKKIFGYKGAINTILLMILCAPLYLYTPIVYTDTLAVMFPVLTIYLYLLYKENLDGKKKYIYLAIMTVINGIAFCIKPVAAIVYVAILIDMLFANKKTIIQSIVSVVIFIIIMQSFTYFANKQFVVTDITINIKVPTMHYIMLGLSKPTSKGGTNDNDGWGSYNEEDYMYTMTKPNYYEKEKADKVRIKERLNNYGIFGYVDFLWNKLKFTWNDGTYYSLKCIGLDTINKDSKIYNIVLGDYEESLAIPYMQYFNKTIMILILAGFIYDLKNNKKDIIRILEISMVGIAMFLLIWETRSRYIYFMIPVFIVLATNSVNSIMEKINVYKIKRLEENKNK